MHEQFESVEKSARLKLDYIRILSGWLMVKNAHP